MYIQIIDYIYNYLYGGFQKWGSPKWMVIMDNPIKIDDLGWFRGTPWYPHFRKPSYSTDHQHDLFGAALALARLCQLLRLVVARHSDACRSRLERRSFARAVIQRAKRDMHLVDIMSSNFGETLGNQDVEIGSQKLTASSHFLHFHPPKMQLCSGCWAGCRGKPSEKPWHKKSFNKIRNNTN